MESSKLSSSSALLAGSFIELAKRLINLFKRSYNAESNIVPFLSISNSDKDILEYDKIIL